VLRKRARDSRRRVANVASEVTGQAGRSPDVPAPDA
jgi:hypothetical protein